MVSHEVTELSTCLSLWVSCVLGFQWTCLMFSWILDFTQNFSGVLLAFKVIRRKYCHFTQLSLQPFSSTSSYPDGDVSIFNFCFSVCHLVGMLSALANPVLYGYFNQVCCQLIVWIPMLYFHLFFLQGFKKEFSKILCSLSGKWNCHANDGL